MPNYRKLVEEAVRKVRADEKRHGRDYTDEEVKAEVQKWVTDERGGFNNDKVPVASDTLFKMLKWAEWKYIFLLLDDLRRGPKFRDHRTCKPSALGHIAVKPPARKRPKS